MDILEKIGVILQHDPSGQSTGTPASRTHSVEAAVAAPNALWDFYAGVYHLRSISGIFGDFR